MKRLVSLCALTLLYCLTASTQSTHLEGVLIDKACSYKAETRIVPGGHLEGGMLEAYVHPRSCLLMPDCRKSGYGVFTYDQKFVAFDAEGNKKALALIQGTKQEDNFRVEVTGTVQGDTIKVTSIKLQ